MAVTIFDIAEKSGYSISTVSRVLNNSGPVKEKTRERIMEIIEELNYVPNDIAQSLVRKSTKMLGIVVADINNPFYSQIVRGIEDETDKFGYNIILCNSDEKMVKEKKIIEILLKKQVDGIIFAGGRGKGKKYNNHIIKLSEKIPVVLANEYLRGDNIYCVTCDKKKGAYLIVKHLIELGHKNIGFINGMNDYKPSIEKYEGYKKALKEAGIELQEDKIINSDYHMNGGYESAKLLMRLPERPTAIFAANDLMAIGAIKALKSMNFKVPEDVAVAGFDDIALNEYFDPTLSSVDQNLYKLGSQAVLLMDKIFKQSSDIKKKNILETVVKLRESTGDKL